MYAKVLSSIALVLSLFASIVLGSCGRIDSIIVPIESDEATLVCITWNYISVLCLVARDEEKQPEQHEPVAPMAEIIEEVVPEATQEQIEDIVEIVAEEMEDKEMTIEEAAEEIVEAIEVVVLDTEPYYGEDEPEPQAQEAEPTTQEPELPTVKEVVKVIKDAIVEPTPIVETLVVEPPPVDPPPITEPAPIEEVVVSEPDEPTPEPEPASTEPAPIIQRSIATASIRIFKVSPSSDGILISFKVSNIRNTNFNLGTTVSTDGEIIAKNRITSYSGHTHPPFEYGDWVNVDLTPYTKYTVEIRQYINGEPTGLSDSVSFYNGEHVHSYGKVQSVGNSGRHFHFDDPNGEHDHVILYRDFDSNGNPIDD